MHLRTKVVHVARPVPGEAPAPMAEPITATTNYRFRDLDQLAAAAEGAYPGQYYYRYGTPTVRALEQAVAELEGAESAVATASGMAAIAAGLLSLSGNGRRVLLPKGVYGGTYALATEVLEPLGFSFTFADPLDEESFVRAADGQDVVLLEPITNPLVRLVNTDVLIPRVKEVGPKVLVDSTFATPCLLQPLGWGADAVVHAASKYLSGHSDTTGGLIVGSREVVDRARSTVSTFGAAMSPFDAFLILRGIRTLALRIEVQSSNALEIASRLVNARGVDRVYYPLLPSDQHYERAKRLLNGRAGGIVSFELAGGLPAVKAFLSSLRMVRLVPGLADVATTINHPASTSHRHLPEADRIRAGITDGLLRLSVGIEDVDDLWQELQEGLEAVG